VRVAIVQEHVDLSRGGAETSTLEMACQLARHGCDVTVLCRGPIESPLEEPGVSVRPLVVGGPTRALRTYRYIQAVQRLCRNERFDIVHAVTPCLAADIYQPRGGTYAETLSRSLALTRSPLVRRLRAFGRRFNIRQQFLMRLERTLLTRRAGRVVVAALSDYVHRQVLDLCRATSGVGPAPPVRVVFNGVDVAAWAADERSRLRAERRAALGIGDSTPLVLFAAHNYKLKGLGELIRALAHGAARPDALLVVAGRGRPARYQRLARRHALADRVRFVGTAPSLRGWYAAADVLAHPTWYDPCSRVVLEALSLGLPVVTTRYNGAAEAMVPGRHGVVIHEPADAAALAAALGRGLQRELRAACAADAACFAERYSMARHARELVALYKERRGTR